MNVLAAAQAIAQMRGAADDYAGDNWPEMAKALTKWADALDPHRAAVTELIEADKEYDEAIIAVVRTVLDGQADSAMPGEATARIDAAEARRAAALARVQGVQS